MRRPFSSTQRWPLVVAQAPERATRSARLVFGSFGLLLLGTALATGAALPLAIRGLVAAIAVVLFVVAARPRRAPQKASGTIIEADGAGLSRLTADAATPLVRWGEPFGVTILASYGRPMALLAFTSPAQTRYVPVRIDGRDDADDELFSRIAVLADLDLVDGVAHEPALTASSAAAVLRHVAAKDDAALGRAYLSDGRGTPIALDRATLSIGSKTFDLTSHLEWRPLMFHESTGQGAALYQATRITQGSVEVVLVAPMPASIVPREANAHRDASGMLGRALTRHLKLLQAPAESPPPRDTRVAIDRPFMLAVRRILGDAPLALRTSPDLPTPRARTERPGSLA